MSRPIADKVYDLYGRFYDSFEVVFKRRMAKALADMPLKTGDRVLDVGVGTGLSLEFYPRGTSVVGLDLSQGMLEQAQRKIRKAAFPNVTASLVRGDALALPFPDHAFDAVFMSHVISTVPDPARCLREALRVSRDGAVIALVNHFRSDIPVVSLVETAVDPICRKLGWRSDLSLPELLQSLEVKNITRLRPSLFQIAYLQKVGATVHMLTAETLASAEPAFGPV